MKWRENNIFEHPKITTIISLGRSSTAGFGTETQNFARQGSVFNQTLVFTAACLAWARYSPWRLHMHLTHISLSSHLVMTRWWTEKEIPNEYVGGGFPCNLFLRWLYMSVLLGRGTVNKGHFLVIIIMCFILWVEAGVWRKGSCQKCGKMEGGWGFRQRKRGESWKQSRNGVRLRGWGPKVGQKMRLKEGRGMDTKGLIAS